MVVDALWDGLVALDDLGRPVPAGAESWTFGPPGAPPAVVDDRGRLDAEAARHLVLTLRRGATWHDGTPVTAPDFVRGLRRVVDDTDGTASPYAYLLEDVVGHADARAGGELAGVRALDDGTLHVESTRPAVGLLERLAHPALAPAHPDLATTEVAATPPGNGPFVLAEPPVPDEFVRVRRHDGWGLGPAPDGGPWLDEVIFRVYSADAAGHAQYADVVGGRVDVAAVPASRRDEAITRFGASPHPRRGNGVLTGTVISTWSYGFDVAQAPFSAPRLRRVVAAAVDPDEVVDGLLAGTRTVLRGILPRGVVGARPDACGSTCGGDVGAALAALDVEPVLTAPSEVIVTHNAGSPHDAIAAVVARQLREALPWDAASRAVPAGAYVDLLRTGPPPGPFRLGWIPDVPTGLAVVEPQFHSREIGRSNLVRLSDPAVDALLDAATRTPDLLDRTALLQEAEDRILDLAVVIPMSTGRLDVVVAPSVRGFRVDAVGRPDLAHAWLAVAP